MFDDFETNEAENFGFSEPIVDEPEGLLSPRESYECLGHDNVEKILLDLIDSGAMPHAIIFNGLEGVGKSTMAFRLVRYLLKNGTADSAQDSLFGDAPAAATSLNIDRDDPVFSRVVSGGHPDLLTIERPQDAKKGTQKNSVDVETARKVAPFLRMTSSDGGWRVVIIDDADTMNRNAQNAMLKILEEPPKNALLILVAHRIGALIPTIRSRCRVLNFLPLDDDALTALLMKEVGQTISEEDKAILNAMSQGSIGRAKQILDIKGLDVVYQVLDILKTYPDFNWVDIHHLSDQAGKMWQNGTFEMINRTFLWAIESIIQSQAKNISLPVPLNGSEFASLCASYNLQKWIEVFDTLKDHFNKIEFSNLDKRQGVLQAFNIIKS